MARSILVVDDSLMIRKSLRDLLESHGFRVLEADSGEAGVSAAQAENVDMIVVDVNMPGMDGLMMIEEVRKLPGYDRTPAFVLTTETDSSLLKRGKRVGATAWIVKPFKPETLLKGINQVLGS